MGSIVSLLKNYAWGVVRSFEEALLSREPNEILSQLLAQFILNLKPQTRNLR